MLVMFLLHPVCLLFPLCPWPRYRESKSTSDRARSGTSRPRFVRHNPGFLSNCKVSLVSASAFAVALIADRNGDRDGALTVSETRKRRRGSMSPTIRVRAREVKHVVKLAVALSVWRLFVQTFMRTNSRNRQRPSGSAWRVTTRDECAT